MRPSVTVRVARVAVPLALVGLGTSGVVAFALPGSDAQTAVPAPATSVPDTAALREQPVSRDLVRTPSPTPTLTATPSPTATPTPSATPKAKAAAKPKAPSADDLA